MLTPQDVRSVQFEKNLRGYRTEDVDHFLDKVEQQLEQDAEQMETLRKQVADLTAEADVLLLGAGGGAARPLHRSVRPAPRRGELRLSGAGPERGKPFVPLHR